MNNTRTKKNLFTITAAFVLSALLFCAILLSNPLYAKGAEKQIKENEFASAAVTVANGEFDSFSGTTPATPSSWTKTIPQVSGEGATKAGVIDLAAYSANAEATKLDKYDEYKNAAPVSPFGDTNFSIQGDKKFLMINTDASATVYGYKSQDLTLASNKYYNISVWVKTGDFPDNKGASVRLSGLDGNWAFTNINTVKNIAKNLDGIPDLEKAVSHSGYGNTFGWEKYQFYIATGSLKTYSAAITLSVGDYYSGENADGKQETFYSASKGYAFFDKVEAYEVSATSYNKLTQSSNDFKQIIDLGLKTAFAGTDKTDPAYNAQADEQLKFAFSYANWTSKGSSYADLIAFSADSQLIDGQYNLEYQPVSSTGRNNSESYLENIMMISSYDEGVNIPVSSGIESAQKLKVERFKYYRLSLWVKTDNISGAGANIVLTTNKLKSTLIENDIYKTPEENPANYESFSQNSVTGDAANGSRYGWKEYAFYIQGSSIKDYEIGLQLWLGTADSKASGTAMFHNIRFDKLTYDDYSSYNSNGTAVSFEGTYSTNDAGVTNGEFMTAGSFKDYKFPLAPAAWTYIDASTAGTAGYSTSAAHIKNNESGDDIIKGIMPTDNDHFYSRLATDYKGFDIINPTNGQIGNVLVIGSTKATAIGYRSSDINITAATTQKISVTLRTALINGYGASLVLKNGSNVIASIENITETYAGSNIKGFETFNFYVEGGDADQSVTLEIWLGLIDRRDNSTKLSSGNIYVLKASAEAVSEGTTYAQLKSAYDSAKSSGQKPKNATYSFKSEAIDAFDYYDNNFVKYPYNWSLTSLSNAPTNSVKYGIFDSTSFKAGNGEVPSTFRNSPDAVSNNVMLLNNSTETASKLTLNKSYTLAATSYYRFRISMKVDIKSESDKSVGAGIVLSGTNLKFNNIKSTALITDSIVDAEAFKTFEFYVATGTDAITATLEFTLGGTKVNQYCAGSIYINNIEFSDITAPLYESETENLKDAKFLTDSQINETGKLYQNSAVDAAPAEETPPADDSGSGSVNWWLVPSILFSAALLFALVAIVVRKVAEKVSKRRSVKYETASGYDRDNTLNRERVYTKTPSGKISIADPDADYAEFDDVLPPAPDKVKVVREVKAEEIEHFDDSAQNTPDAVETAETENAAESLTSDQAEQPAAKAIPKYTDEFDD